LISHGSCTELADQQQLITGTILSGAINNMNKNKYQKGFTFVELLLYLGILTIMLSALVPFAWNIIGSGSKSNTQEEVFSQARFISQRINYEIRSASGINSVSPTSLSLATSVSATNPTVIDLSAGKIRIKQGTGAVVNLNSDDSTVSTLQFANYSSPDGKTKNINYLFTLNSAYDSVRQEFSETTTISSDAELRSN
jgi:Tfp pilus assembly protein FimT